MEKRLPSVKVLLLVMTLIFSCEGFAQLPAFTLNVTPTAQTCLGNGSMAFTVSGTNSSATIDYAVFLLPNTTTPVAIATTPAVGGLVAGNYLVVATQSLAGESNTATANVTITNSIVPLAYNLTPTMVRCGNDGVITVNITNGVGALYEIISGPVVVPPQASNVLTGLPVGTYQVRVYDNCGEANVTSVQLIQLNTGLSISSAAIQSGMLPACNLINVSHNVQVTGLNLIVFYPLTCEFTIYPPGGGTPAVVTTQVNSGPFNGVAVLGQIPFYHGQQYTYNLKVTDACGNVYNRNNVIVNRSISVSVEQAAINCGDNAFSILPAYFVLPVTINFTQAPAGFDPVNFNPGHPTFNAVPVSYGNTMLNPVPIGHYEFILTDACGHSVTHSFDTIPVEVVPQLTAQLYTCDTEGYFGIEMIDRDIVSVVIIEAPESYPNPLEDDVSEFITPDGGFLMGNIPMGDYEIVVTDSCGDEHEMSFSLEPPVLTLSVSQNPGCEEGYGSVRITSGGSPIGTVQIIDAPDDFVGTLPLNVTGNIAVNGRFYMNSLIEGEYVFRVTDDCNGMADLPVSVEGYHIQQQEIHITPTCSSFNLELHHTSNGDNFQTFYLQRYNEAEGTWEHPVSGDNYTEGSTPNTTNSYLLNNNADNINIQSLGQFRIIKLFYVWGNGSSANFRCLDIIEEFMFDGAPVIIDAYSFPCAGGLTEVIVVGEGVPPLTYKITTKNGEPFLVDNGTSSHFSGLEPATYNFQVADYCGNLRNIQFDINALDPIELTAQGFCEGEASSLSVDEFSFLTYEWWEESNPEIILSTSGTLSFPSYNSATQSGTYYVSISSPIVGSCINQLLSYEAAPNTLPQAGPDNSIIQCNINVALNLENYLTQPYDQGGTWEDLDNAGTLSGSLFTIGALPEGTYHFAYKVSTACRGEDTAIITIELRDAPDMPVISVTNPVCEGSPVQLSTAAVPGASYLWTGPDNFTSTDQNPIIASPALVNAGTYSLTVTVNNCASPTATQDVVVNPLPLAGPDAALSFCNDGQQLDLNDYLSVPFVPGGIWEDTDNTGALAGSSFTTAAMAGGTYHFTYRVSNACGQDDAVITIELKERPSAPVITPLAPACEGSSVQMLAAGVAGASYQWSGPGSFASTEQNPVLSNISTAQGGTYSLIITVNGCASPPSVVNITVNPLPEFTIGGTPSFCEGQSTVISVEPDNFPENGVAYAWYHDGELLAGIDQSAIEVFEPGIYNVEVTRNGCTASQEISVTRATGLFTVELDAGCRNNEYVITIANIGDINGADFVWTGPDGYHHIGGEAIITNLSSGEYFVTVTNAEGCAENASIIVDNTTCFIPRGISPNGDSYNNSFDLSNLDVKHIKIFNRYGLEVYEKDNYLNEWHGQSHRGELPTGTYYYVLTLSAGKRVTGWVYLQRQVN
ncbi:gliding motility-associated C-terminal domain-containing protein [Flavobacterium sp. MFBS3-15]|uniref:T9SS type B sorting domain-containing protein n=1 Tax=Flavobacterium sp. MFBS3-15 TaxID=2989816 RepID=UPI00223610BC|nr:gliding motility-associated C-terminal domain-containing protein [Flavobacterium sp. MFBS3-15]MCW4470694.1 gliding motility-associated C-terminal domain-containing protein [Flavobacterium sp. MFBS3-15]